MRLIALAALLCAAPAAAQFDEEWYKLNTSSTGAVVYALTEDLLAGRPDQRAARMWVKIDARNDASVTFAEAKTLYVVDCRSETYIAAQHTTYNRQGRQLLNFKGSGEMKAAVPGTVMGDAVDLLCSGAD